MEAKVAAAAPRNPKAFAFTVGHNWAADQARDNAVVERRLAQEARHAELEAKNASAFEAAKAEVKALIERLTPTLRSPLQERHLKLVWWRYFEGKRNAECAELLPGTELNNREQMTSRGRRLLLKHARGKELKTLLGHRPSRSGGPATATEKLEERRRLDKTEREKRAAEERRVLEEQQRALEAMKAEAKALIEHLIPTLRRETQQRNLQLVSWVYFDGKTLQECGGLLPGTTLAGREAMLHRGRELIRREPQSEELRKHLARRAWHVHGGPSKPSR
jgi:hypothetical protein